MGRHTTTCASALLTLLAAAGCTSSHGPSGACEGAAPACRRDVLPPLLCCGEVESAARCIDGRWSCDPGQMLESECSGGVDCVPGPPPPLVDAGGDDAGPPPPPVVDAGTSACGELGAADCFGDADCAPLFDDRCCPSCSEGPCADCFDPGYVGCIAFDDCRAPACGVVPSWGCYPSAPDCTGATPIALDSCSAYGCVPAYPAGDGDPSLADAICVPITGVSCTTSCRRLPPTCPSGTVPEGDGFCYTDRCIPAFVCE